MGGKGEKKTDAIGSQHQRFFVLRTRCLLKEKEQKGRRREEKEGGRGKRRGGVFGLHKKHTLYNSPFIIFTGEGRGKGGQSNLAPSHPLRKKKEKGKRGRPMVAGQNRRKKRRQEKGGGDKGDYVHEGGRLVCLPLLWEKGGWREGEEKREGVTPGYRGFVYFRNAILTSLLI